MKQRGNISHLFLSIALLASVSGCTNNLLQRTTRSGLFNSGSSPDGGATTLITLSRVAKNAQDPGNVLDLVDDGSGTIGQFCIAQDNTGTPASGGGSGNAGPTTCNCTFSYTKADGTAESFDAPTVYRESDLIRCSYSNVPRTVSNVKVKIHITTAGAYSNEILLNLAIGAGQNLDLSSIDSYVSAQRYQCRDSIFIPGTLDTNVYDPLQSEDPRLAYPLNFYSTNLGGSLALFASSTSPATHRWSCPAIPNDPNQGYDLRVFSKAPDPSSNSRSIFPPAPGGFDRSSFSLARIQTGIFTVPVNALVAPTIVTGPPVTGGTLPPPIGYGAAPIPNGANQEVCPESQVTIPQGYHWVKVWLFRSTLDPRRFSRSQGVANLNSVRCNPGLDPQTGQAIYADCGNAGLTFTSGLADRILGTGMCVNLAGPRAPCNAPGPGCTTLNPTTQFPGYEGLSLGSDTWGTKLAIAGNPLTVLSCGGASFFDPMNLCPQVPNSAPFDRNIVIGDLDQGNARFDYLFVVTPKTVMAAQMRNSTLAANLPYTPYRFLSAADCPVADPDLCNQARRVDYQIKFNDVATAGDPPGGDPNRAGVFPICAIQKD